MTKQQEKTIELIFPRHLRWKRWGKQYELEATDKPGNALHYRVLDCEQDRKTVGRVEVMADGFVSRFDRASDLIKRKIEALHGNLKS